MTLRLYYDDSYLTHFEAQIVEIGDEGRRVYLDRTAFYPTSGGQPHDFGQLGGQEVVDVEDEGDRIVHVLATPLTAQTSVAGRVDWDRRFDHMQQHTGQHLLSSVFADQFGFQTLSFHLGPEVATIDLGTAGLTDTQIDLAEMQSNAIVRQARPISIQYEEASSVEGLRKASQRAGDLRIVQIEGLDRSACGGTHVRSTAEIGPIQIRRLEKVRGNIRVEFMAGIRASRRAKQDFRLLANLSKTASAAVDGLPDHLIQLRQRLADSEKERGLLAAQLAQMQARTLHQSTVPDAGGIRRIWLRIPALNEEARIQAQEFASLGKAVMVVVGADPCGVLVAVSRDAGINAGAILKGVLATTGGRGGGSTTLAQGTLPNQDAEDMLAGELGFSARG